MKVVGEKVNIIIIETGCELGSLREKHFYMKVSNNFDHTKALKLSVTICSRTVKGK